MVSCFARVVKQWLECCEASIGAVSHTDCGAYLHFRSAVIGLLEQILDTANRSDVAGEAERLIALVNGISLQALFDPDLWTDQYQTAALEAGIGPVAW